MPNPNYLKGRRKEQNLVKEARKRGLIALRSAGSKSPIDCVVIDIQNMQIDLIQCKPEDFPEIQRLKIETQFIKLNGLFKVCFKVL